MMLEGGFVTLPGKTYWYANFPLNCQPQQNDEIVVWSK